MFHRGQSHTGIKMSLANIEIRTVRTDGDYRDQGCCLLFVVAALRQAD